MEYAIKTSPASNLQDCHSQQKLFNYRLLTIVFLLIFTAVLTAFLRLTIDTDIVRSLPSDKNVISDALDIFTSHPIHDQIAIDITLNTDDQNTLVNCGEYVEERLRSSTLFAKVGTDEMANLIPGLALHITDNLPILFSKQELEQLIAPRLEQTFIDHRLADIVQKLSSLEGIGQSSFIASDPLGFMEPIMAKLTMLAPLSDTSIYKGFIFSPDKRHLLVTARPNSTGTDTASARQIAELLDSIATELNNTYTSIGINPVITPVGAYRAALDNERIIRHDVNWALFLSTAGIGLLLFIAFPRPLIGLFSLLPALAGTATALLIFSLFHSSISIMVLGFGGAIISITVDHGIAYLLFLDRPKSTKGKEASGEVRAIGFLAVLTTCGAFLTLGFSGFPVFVQLGQFTALGVLFSFLFVHFIFPHITPSMPPSSRHNLPLQKAVDAFYNTGRTGAIAATFLAASLIFFARPDFNVSLESMNTVSNDTRAADTAFTTVWGSINSNIVLMTTGSKQDIQRENDHILQQIKEDTASHKIASAFVPSMIFPGDSLAQQNFDAWQSFWTENRVKELQKELSHSGDLYGFAGNGFDQFLQNIIAPKKDDNIEIPEEYYTMLGISNKQTFLTQFINVTPGTRYNSEHFNMRYGQIGKIFDSPYFSKQLADILFRSFATMLGIIAISIVILLLFFYASWRLTLITLIPPIFSYICTLGTMKLIGHALDIPGLMLSIVILGMGIDYSIFFVRAQQRYRNPAHPSFGLIRMAVFMAGCSTIIGFGVLCLAEHSLLKSIGITSLLGIGYSLLGSFLLLPPLLKFYFSETRFAHSNTFSLLERVRKRYHFMEAYPRMFARFKLQTDPMFTDLPKLLADDRDSIKTILDIGCGYGVPGCWCLEFFPNATVFGIDPDSERVRVAALAMGDRGVVLEDMAPDLPILPNPPDLILLLDMLHYLDDSSISTLLQNCFETLNIRGLLLIRFVIAPSTPPSWSFKLEDNRVRFSSKKAYYRTIDTMTNLMEQSGFTIEKSAPTENNPELAWLIGRVQKP